MPIPDKRPLKVFLCHAHIREPVRALYMRLKREGVDVWLDKAKLHGERSRTILPGRGFDRLNLPDWEMEIRKAVRASIICSQEKAGNL